MQLRAITCVVVVLNMLAACGGEDDASQTQVAVSNGGTASIDATVSDGEAELSFEGIAAGSTSSFQNASFGALSALTVTVGTQTSTVDLGAGVKNVIEIGADAKVERVVQQAAPSGGGDDKGW